MRGAAGGVSASNVRLGTLGAALEGETAGVSRGVMADVGPWHIQCAIRQCWGLWMQ